MRYKQKKYIFVASYLMVGDLVPRVVERFIASGVWRRNSSFV